MGGGLIPDDIHHRCIRPARVVNVGNPVGEPWPAMEERHGRFLRHPRVAVGAAGHHGLGHSEDAAHALDSVKGKDEVYLRGAGIGKANLNPGGNKSADHAFCAVHNILLLTKRFFTLSVSPE